MSTSSDGTQPDLDPETVPLEIETTPLDIPPETMAKHAAPEGRHRRGGELVAQGGLMAVLGLVSVAVLLGSGLMRDRMASDGPTGPQAVEQVTPGTSAPETTPEASMGPSAPSLTTTASTTATVAPSPSSAPVRFASCAEAKAAGVSLIPRSDPRYRRRLDRDGDGVACDRHGDPPTPGPRPPFPPAACFAPRPGM